jgi:hypothetical protein
MIFLIGCVEKPNSPDLDSINDEHVLVLNEGLLGMENASISLIDKNLTIIKDHYKNNNKNLLGDTANDIVLKGDTAIVVLTGSGVIELFDVRSGKSIQRKAIQDFYPRSVAIYQSEIFVSDLYANKIYKFDHELNYDIFTDQYLQNPEQLILIEDKLYVVNSGLGIFNLHKDFAGTISVFDLRTGEIINNVRTGTNPQEIIYDSIQKNIIVSYYNTYEKDSIGGIIIYSDLSLSNVKKHIKINNSSMQLYNDNLYFISQTPPGSDLEFNSSIQKMDLKNFKQIKLIENNSQNEFWYSLKIENENKIWIGNAMNFQVEGEIIYYDHETKNTYRNNVGVNPAKILILE